MSLSNKKAVIFLITAAVLISIAPFLSVAFDKTELVDKDGINIDNRSINQISYCYKKSFTLDKGEKLILELSVPYANTSITLIIVGRGEYKGLDHHTTSPLAFTTQYNFLKSEFIRWEDPSGSTSSANALILTNDEYYFIEFMGDVSSGSLESVPGAYLLLAYATDHPDGEPSVEFDLKMSLDGPYDSGDLIGFLFPTIGLLLIAYVGISTFKTLIRKWRAN